MGEVILMAQLTREFHLFLFFLAPISIICEFLFVFISLPFLSSLLLPIRMLISLLRGMRKKHLHFGVRGNPLLPLPRMFNEQLMELFGQIFYSGRINRPNHTIGMGSRLRFLCIVCWPRCLKDNLIQDPRLRVNQV